MRVLNRLESKARRSATYEGRSRVGTRTSWCVDDALQAGLSCVGSAMGGYCDAVVSEETGDEAGLPDKFGLSLIVPEFCLPLSCTRRGSSVGFDWGRAKIGEAESEVELELDVDFETSSFLENKACCSSNLASTSSGTPVDPAEGGGLFLSSFEYSRLRPRYIQHGCVRLRRPFDCHAARGRL